MKELYKPLATGLIVKLVMDDSLAIDVYTIRASVSMLFPLTTSLFLGAILLASTLYKRRPSRVDYHGYMYCIVARTGAYPVLLSLL